MINKIKLDMMKGMVSILNEAANAYYNTGNPIMTDEQFDARLEDLRHLEEETGFVLSNSPTHNVGAKILTELNEVTHSVPMLSLEKCHTVEELVKFANNKELVFSIKLDGLTCRLTYENGILVRGETRGNGYVGNDVTEHVKRFKNVPLKIDKQNTYIVDGECVITDKDFAEVNKNGEYKNSRNLAAGTLSVFDTSLVSQRRLSFYAWDIIEGGNSNKLKDNLDEAKTLCFDTVPSWVCANLNPKNPQENKNIQNNIDYIFDYALENGYPNDGIVFKFNDIAYGKSLGATSHHFKNGIAYKAKDDVYETELIDIDWTVGKSGQITPTAIFQPVEIENTTVERASVHNVSILTSLDLHKGDIIEVKKCNQIIPQIHRNVSADERKALNKEIDHIIIPSTCPICGGNTEVKQDSDSKVLICTNDNCRGKLLGKLTHFVSKNAMDIENLSEATLEKFIELNWLNDFADIYNLKHHYNEMVNLDGFGETSANKLLNAIEVSKDTTLDRFIYALSIPLIGKSASKTIAKYFKGSFENFYNECVMHDFDFRILNDFGDSMNESMHNYLNNNFIKIGILSRYMSFEIPQINSNNTNLSGLTFVITGGLNYFTNRDEAKEKIESSGGKVSGSVSVKTDFLVCNEVSGSSKYQKAQSLGVKIIKEEELIKMLNM